MRLAGALNLLAYAGALAAAGLAAWIATPCAAVPVAVVAAPTATVAIEVLPDGRPAVRDAHGIAVPVGDWRRIAALDLVADDLVASLVEPARIAAASAWTQGPEAWRLAGLPRVPGLDDLEGLIRLRPDLVLLSTYGGEDGKLQRLRDAGIQVFDLGQAGGIAALTANIRRVAAVTGNAPRGERLARQIERRMASASRLPAGAVRRRALVLTPVVDQVYGGTVGSSFHDLLTAAGLVDVAAGRFAAPWPRIGAEDALALDPELIVTRAGAAAELRRVPGFDRLRALQRPGGVIELPVELFDSPGVSLPDAAEALSALAYPEAR